MAGVRVQRDGGVASIVLDRPERRNAFDAAMASAFSAALGEVADAAVVVLRGAGPAFCAGWDLRELAALAGAPRSELELMFARNRDMLAAFAALPMPTIAAAHGAVAGFGLSLVARADIALADAGTRFALPEIAHGIVPAMVLLDLPRSRRGLEWLLTGSRFSAREACDAGLVTRVAEDLDAAVAELTGVLAEHDAAAAAATKRAFREVRELAPEEAERRAIAGAVDALSGLGQKYGA